MLSARAITFSMSGAFDFSEQRRSKGQVVGLRIDGGLNHATIGADRGTKSASETVDGACAFEGRWVADSGMVGEGGVLEVQRDGGASRQASMIASSTSSRAA